MSDWSKKCADAMRTVFGYALVTLWVSVVLVVCLIAIVSCVFLVFGEKQYAKISEYVPLLEKLVWPSFLLVLVFGFKREVNLAMKEIPGLLHRSSLPHSATLTAMKPGQEDAPLLTSAEGIPHNGKKRLDADTIRRYRESEKLVLALLQREYGVKVVPDVVVGKSPWRADGAFDFQGVRYFVAVLSFDFKDRVPKVLSRIKRLSALVENSVFILFVFGCDEVEDFIDSASASREKVVLRAKKFSEKDLKEGEKS